MTPRLAKLARRRTEVAREIATLDRAIGKIRGKIGVSAQRTRQAGGVGRIARKPNARRLNDITVKDAIVGLLRSKRRPMHYRDIASALVKEGRYRSRSRNFLTTVAITILRDRRLKRVEPGVYALRKGV